MKIFLDTGDVEAIRKMADTGLLDGVTTNPSHIAKTGRKLRNVVKTNVTMIFSPTQAFPAMKAGASFASIVLSRLDAVGNESDLLVQDAAIIRNNYGLDSEVLAGSVKTQNHLLVCLRAGIDIATIPPELFFQMFRYPLTEAGLAQFAKDWQKVPK